MKNNWLQFYRICSAVPVEEDFDDYGSGEYLSVMSWRHQIRAVLSTPGW